MASEIHVADVGTAFRCTIIDEDGAIVDISGSTTRKIWFQKPDKSVVEFNATLVTDGTDGRMMYVTSSASDLDQAGRWKMQGYVEFGSYQLHSNFHKFKVYPNLK